MLDFLPQSILRLIRNFIRLSFLIATRIFCFIALLCAITLLQVANKAWMLFIFAAIYGFSHGGLFTVVSITVAELFGTDSHGILFGIILFIGTIGGIAGPFRSYSSFLPELRHSVLCW